MSRLILQRGLEKVWEGFGIEIEAEIQPNYFVQSKIVHHNPLDPSSEVEHGRIEGRQLDSIYNGDFIQSMIMEMQQDDELSIEQEDY